MEIPENTKEGAPKASLRQFLLRKAEEKKDKALEGKGKGYSPQDKENVLSHYQVVIDHLRRLPQENYTDVSSIITILNEIAKEGVEFPNVGNKIRLSNSGYKILAIYPSEIDVLDAIKETPKATTFIAGANFWDNPFNPKQVFLPGNYILKGV